MKITTIEVRGAKYDIDVNDVGQFGTNFDGEWIRKKSLEELRDELVRLTRIKTKKISIPFIMWDGKKMLHGICTGKHGSNRNLLIRYQGEKGSKQESPWSLDHAVDPGDEIEYTKLCVEFERVKKAKENFENRHVVDLKKLVAAALEEGGDE